MLMPPFNTSKKLLTNFPGRHPDWPKITVGLLGVECCRHISCWRGLERPIGRKPHHRIFAFCTGPPRTDLWFRAEQHVFGPGSTYEKPGNPLLNRKGDNAVASRRSGAHEAVRVARPIRFSAFRRTRCRVDDFEPNLIHDIHEPTPFSFIR